MDSSENPNVGHTDRPFRLVRLDDDFEAVAASLTFDGYLLDSIISEHSLSRAMFVHKDVKLQQNLLLASIQIATQRAVQQDEFNAEQEGEDGTNGFRIFED